MTHLNGEQAGQSPVYQREQVATWLGGVAAEPDINKQFMMLNRYEVAGKHHTFPFGGKAVHVDEIDQLLAFGGNPASSPSLLVRAQALELAYDLLPPITDDLDPALRERRIQIMKMTPRRSEHRVQNICNPGGEILTALGSSTYVATYGPDDFNPYPYRDAVRRIARHDGMKEDTLFPDWNEISGEPGAMSDYVPVTALFMLDHIVQMQHNPDRLPLNHIAGLMPLAVEMQRVGGVSFAALQPHAIDVIYADVQKIDTLLQYGEKGDAYVEAIQDFYQVAEGLSGLFPPEYANGVERSARLLVSNSVYAVTKHLQQEGHTRVDLPLNNDPNAQLPLRLEGDEPLVLLRTLVKAIRQLTSHKSDDRSSTTLFADEPDFRAYRLWLPSSFNSKQASVYIRPEGAADLVQSIEYGNRHKGVEASISYVIDPTATPGRLLKIGPQRDGRPDNRISIRLDREGVAPEERGKPGVQRDPSQYQGTLSLDIGSVLGNQNGLGTKLGRFLAWGNVLRCQELGQDPQLNHVVQYFSERHGQADYFASAARSLISKMENRRLDGQKVAELLSGRLAVGGSQQQEKLP